MDSSFPLHEAAGFLLHMFSLPQLEAVRGSLNYMLYTGRIEVCRFLALYMLAGSQLIAWFAFFMAAVLILLWEDECASCRRKKLLSLCHLTAKDLCPPLTSLWKKPPCSALLLSIKRKDWAGILTCLVSMGWYKLSEAFYSPYHQRIKALKFC